MKGGFLLSLLALAACGGGAGGDPNLGRCADPNCLGKSQKRLLAPIEHPCRCLASFCINLSSILYSTSWLEFLFHLLSRPALSSPFNFPPSRRSVSLCPLIPLVPVSAGRTTIRYHGRSPEMLSFKLDESVTIFSKDDGGGGDGLWGVEVRSLSFCHSFGDGLMCFSDQWTPRSRQQAPPDGDSGAAAEPAPPGSPGAGSQPGGASPAPATAAATAADAAASPGPAGDAAASAAPTAAAGSGADADAAAATGDAAASTTAPSAGGAFAHGAAATAASHAARRRAAT